MPAGEHCLCSSCNCICRSSSHWTVDSARSRHRLACSDFRLRCRRLSHELDCDHHAVRAVRTHLAALASVCDFWRMASGARAEEQGAHCVRPCRTGGDEASASREARGRPVRYGRVCAAGSGHSPRRAEASPGAGCRARCRDNRAPRSSGLSRRSA